MQTSKKLYWGAQLIGWSSYSSLIYLSAYIDKADSITYKLIVQLFFMTFFSVTYTHAMRWYMLRKGWLNKRLVALIPRLILISITCAFAIENSLRIIEYTALNQVDTFQNFARSIINTFALTLLVICWNGIYFTFHFFQKSRLQEMNNLALEASKNEIELKNLRSQLNPHFLFNSLNSIRALIDLDPTNAKHAVTTLSNLLRKSLISGKENLISVGEEIEIVTNYLELEKIRFEERLQVEWDLDPALNSFMIPPFSVQMLTENAVKHGISKAIEGGTISISSKRIDRHTTAIIVENTGQLQHSTDTGIGITNTRRRLAIQYNGKADFSLKESENTVIATLKFEHENN